MGKPTGFMELRRQDEASLPVAERLKNYREFVQHLTDEQAAHPGRTLHGLRHPFLYQRLPRQQHHSGLE